MLTNPIVLWLAVGVIFLSVNKMVSRYNLTYAAYSAFTVAVFLMIGIMRLPDPDIAPYYIFFVIGQIMCFALGIGAFAFIFRDTEPKSKLGRSKEFYDNIIGKTVEIGENGMNSVSGGKVTLAGETYQAKLAEDIEMKSAVAGTKMMVKEVIGDTLILIPKT